MEEKKLQSNLGLFLVITGLTAFVMSMFHKKSRQFTLKLIGIGGGFAFDYLTDKYLPRVAPQFVRVVESNFQLRGSKGGKGTKKRVFKRNPKSPKLVAL